MDIDKRISCLNSETKISICLMLEDQKLSLPQIVSKIQKDSNKKVNRETIYRSIESLRDIGIVGKDYFPDERKIKYFLKIKKIELDFLKKKIIFNEGK